MLQNIQQNTEFKPWKYAIISHDQVEKNKSFKGMVMQNVRIA
jgi:hypothetical protein